MNVLIPIVIGQLCFLGILAFILSRWLRRQPDKLVAQYQISQGLVCVACVIIIVSVAVYYLFPSQYTQGYFSSFGPLLILLVFSLLNRGAARRKIDLRNK